MKFVDEVTINVTAGRGGDGCLSFHREPNVPKGGPDGGNGGKGGDVVFVGDTALNTLVDFRYQPKLRAENGHSGSGNLRTGKGGKDLVVAVPCGTTIVDEETLLIVGDITEVGQTITVASGGKQGRGNASFRSSTNRAPRIITRGENGEHRQLRLQLKLIADVGLLGLPNAGKSTLLSRVSASRPKIADYPFTTLIPNLGVVDAGDSRSFVMADVPGLVEGAAEGHGLGTRFLRHLSRTSILLHLVDANPIDGTEPMLSVEKVEHELVRYSDVFAERPIWIVATKTDTLAEEAGSDLVRNLKRAHPGRVVLPLSAVTGAGLGELIGLLADAVDELKANEESLTDEESHDRITEDVMRRSLEERTKLKDQQTNNDDDDDDSVDVVYVQE